MPTRVVLIGAVVLLVVSLVGCAAKTARDRARVGALTVGEAVLALDAAEQQLAAAGVPGYAGDTQRAVNAAVLKVLYAARAYERAVRSYPEAGPVPQQITDAQLGLFRALDDVVQVLPQAESIRAPLYRAVQVIRVALTGSLAARLQDGPLQAQAPLPPQVVGLFALVQLAINLITTGRSTATKIKAALQREGATDEELDQIDAHLSAAIARRASADDAGA